MLIPYKFIINLMNDIPAFVQETNITMYTNDTSIWNITSIEIGNDSCFQYRVCKWLRNNKLSLNIVKTEFTESTPYTIVVEGQEVKRVKLNSKCSVVAMVTALASYFYF